MEALSVSPEWLDSVYTTAGRLGNITDPLDKAVLEPVWTYMTANYSKFTIAFWFSIVLHEVRLKQIIMFKFTRLLTAGLLRFVSARIHCSIPAFHEEVQNSISKFRPK